MTDKDWPASTLGPTEVSFDMVGGIEYAILHADTFRAAMRERDALSAQNERLLADIERWNATIAIGLDRAKQMDAVIFAARAYVEDDSDANWARLNDSVAAYDANPTPLPTAFQSS